MAGDKLPTVQSLERPEKLENILRQDRGDDCLPCKVIGQFMRQLPPVPPRDESLHLLGSGAFFGLGAYSYFSGMSQLERQRNAILQSKSMFGMRSRKFGIISISAGLVWMGLWRAFR
ncbi:Fc.00g100650.m01.CDS01 [Cosmosporella sp. VM-42]